VKTKREQMPELPSLEEARLVIRNNQACYEDWYIAGAILCMNKRSTLADLLACLKRRAAKWPAATILHRRTRRPKKDGEAVIDPKDWGRYLKAKGLL
jgi:hypothetical protein